MKNLGEWELYTPSDIQEGVPANALFWKRLSDEVDFYDWSRSTFEFVDGADVSGTTKIAVIGTAAVCKSVDVSMLSLPSRFSLFEAEEGDVIPQLGWVLLDGIFQPPPAPEPVTVVFKLDLWSRMTDDEADRVGAAMDEQPFRIRKIFESANSYRSDHELWPLLVQIATTLFGEERAAQILAPSA